MTWTSVVSYTPTGGPIVAGSIGNGWTDTGSSASVNSSNVVELTASTNNPWVNNAFQRLGSSELLLDNRAIWRINNLANPYFTVRAHGSPSTISCLCASLSGTLYPVVSGALGSGISGTTNGTAPGTSLWDVEVLCVQTDASHTTVTLNVYSVASAGAALLAGTLGNTVTWSITDAAWQNVAGGVGMFCYGSGIAANIYQFADYTDVSSLSAATLLTVSPSTYSATVGVAHTFTVSTDGTLSVNKTVTLSDGGAGGTFSPTTITLTPASGAVSTGTFSYTPAAAGSVTLTASTSGLTSGTSALTVAAGLGAATALTISPSTATISTGGTQVFTVATNGTIASGKTVALSDGGAGGTFSPSSISLTPQSGAISSGTSTYTAPGSVTSATITASSSGLTSATSAVTVTDVSLPTTYNWYPSTQLAHFLSAYAAVKAGTAGSRCKILCVGDSTTAGFGSDTSNYRGKSYPTYLATGLTARGNTAQWDGFLGSDTSYDSRLTLLGSAALAYPQVLGGYNISTSSVGDGFTFTLPTSGTYDRLDLSYIEQGGGTFSVTVDGGTPQTLTTGTTNNSKVTTLTIPSGSHTTVSVVATNAAATFFLGAAFWSSASPKIQVLNGGMGGATSGTGATASNTSNFSVGYGPLPDGVAQTPDLVLINFGINDILQGVSLSTTLSNLTTLVQAYKNIGASVVLIIPTPITYSGFASQIGPLRSGMQTIATNNSIGLIDISGTYGDSTSTFNAANGGGALGSDGIHPTGIGYQEVGQRDAALLSQAIAASSNNTYSATISESGSAAATSSSVAALTSLVSEAGSATESTSSVVVSSNVITETGSASDTSASLLVSAKITSETESASDSSSTTQVFSRVISEAGSAADTTAAVLVSSGSVSESGSASDSQAYYLAINVIVSDTLAAADATAAIKIGTAQASETGSATDTAVASYISQGSVSEAGNAIDSFGGGSSFATTASDTGSVSESYASQFAGSNTLADGLSSLDTSIIQAVQSGSISETGSTSDSATTTIVSSVLFAETANAIDSSVSVVATVASASETIVAVDIVGAFTNENTSLIEVGSAGDTGSTQFVGSTSVSETGSAAESIIPTLTVSGSVSEAASAGDSSVGVFAPTITAAESLSANDSSAYQGIYVGTINEGSETAYDSSITYVGFLQSNLLSAEDSADTTGVFSTSISEFGTASDTVATTLQVSTVVTDALTASDISSSTEVDTASPSEATTALDTVFSGAVFNSVVSETGAASDTSTATLLVAVSVADNVSIQDGSTGNNAPSNNVAELSGAVDTSATTSVASNAIGENLSSTDSSSMQLIASDTVSDALTASDISSVGQFSGRTISETGSADESCSSVLQAASVFAETITSYDNANSVSLSTVAVVEGGNAADTVTAQFITSGSNAETCSVTAVVGVISTVNIVFAESGNVFDGASAGSVDIAVVSENITGSDICSTFVNYSIEIGDTLTTNDSVGATRASSAPHPSNFNYVVHVPSLIRNRTIKLSTKHLK